MLVKREVPLETSCRQFIFADGKSQSKDNCLERNKSTDLELEAQEKQDDNTMESMNGKEWFPFIATHIEYHRMADGGIEDRTKQMDRARQNTCPVEPSDWLKFENGTRGC